MANMKKKIVEFVFEKIKFTNFYKDRTLNFGGRIQKKKPNWSNSFNNIILLCPENNRLSKMYFVFAYVKNCQSVFF